MKKSNFPLIALFFVFGLFVTCSQPAQKGVDAKKLIGKWVSVDDSKSEIEITDSKWIDSYESAIQFTNNYLVSDTCLKSVTDKPKPKGDYITVFDNTDTFCYYIVSLTDSKLELSYVGRGNTLTYTRKK